MCPGAGHSAAPLPGQAAGRTLGAEQAPVCAAPHAPKPPSAARLKPPAPWLTRTADWLKT
jgi:hypothetical protein